MFNFDLHFLAIFYNKGFKGFARLKAFCYPVTNGPIAHPHGPSRLLFVMAVAIDCKVKGLKYWECGAIFAHMRNLAPPPKEIKA